MTPSARPFAYLRKSVAGRSELDRSRDLQAAAVAALAVRDGVTIARTLDGDWGRSGGRSGRAKRSAMAELIEAVRAGSVSAVYAYSLDRLARDTEYALTLWNACADQGVPIIVDGSRYVTSDAADRMRYVITHEMSAGELDRITKRNRDVKARARENGTALGGRPVYGAKDGEDPAVVVAAYRKAQSFLGAAKALNAAGVPTRFGAPWTVRSVAILVRREDPQAAPERWSRPRVAQRSVRLFSGLLVCPWDGSILLAHSRPGRHKLDGTYGPGSQAYRCDVCTRSGDRSAKGPYMVSESKVLAAAKVAAAGALTLRFAHPDLAAARAAAAAARARRAKVAAADAAVKAGIMTREAADAALRAIPVDDVDHAAEERRAMIGRAVDWDKPVAEVNADLRALWPGGIKLGEDLLPVEYGVLDEGDMLLVKHGEDGPPPGDDLPE